MLKNYMKGANMTKWYACKREFKVPMFNDNNENISDFIVEEGSFWYTDKKDKPKIGNIILNTNTVMIEITKKQLIKDFNDVT